MSMFETKMRLLAHEASRWVGVKEVGGDNKGQLVEIFQKSVDGLSAGEAWCLSFVQYCIKQVDLAYDAFANACMPHSNLKPTEHCLTLWESTPIAQKITPTTGSIMIWQFYNDGRATTSGHAGIVTGMNENGDVLTIEGNTSDGLCVVREGNGVYNRIRSPHGTSNMRVLGFILPWELNGGGI